MSLKLLFIAFLWLYIFVRLCMCSVLPVCQW